MVQKAASWCSLLGDYGSIHYGCGCNKDNLLKMQPKLRRIPWVMSMISNEAVEIYLFMATAVWLLLCPQGYLAKKGEHGITSYGGGGKVNWHCPACVLLYKASVAFKRRVIHIINPEASGDQRVLVSAFVGEIP